MSDAGWLVVAIVLFTGNFICMLYSGWQVFAPFRFRRISTIYFASQRFRVEANKWYWRTIILLSMASCIGVCLGAIGRMTNRSALVTSGMVVILIGDSLAIIGVGVVVYYDKRARNARRRELLEESASVR